MKHFLMMKILEAYRYAEEGGQALHTHNIIVDEKRAPRCFVSAVRRGENIAHLFDQDPVRLVATAKRLGVNVIVMENRGTKRQHVDLCGGPLRKAMAVCENRSKK